MLYIRTQSFPSAERMDGRQRHASVLEENNVCVYGYIASIVVF